MTGDFQLDLQGRLRNFKLPAYRALVPLFEGIANSLHAIEETGRSDGHVTIEIERLPSSRIGSQQALSLGSEQGALPPVVGFRIRDNGIGFNRENYDSFCTSDSRRKLALGGHGVGRFTWLKAFARVRVDSVFLGEDGVDRRRCSFVFSPAGVTDKQERLAEGRLAVETVVSLEDAYEQFVAHIPKKAATIAQRIVDHLFGAIRAAAKPVKIELIDGDDSIDITAGIAQMFAGALVDHTQIANSPFTLTHLRVSFPEVSAHKLVLMANGREVEADNLASFVPQLRAKLEDGPDSFWWWTLVESPALDEHVTAERDGFTLPDKDDVLPGVLSLGQIRKASVDLISQRLEPLIAGIKEKTREQVRRFVETEAPEYRHLFAIRPDLVDQLPPDLKSDRLDAELHRANHELEASVRAQGKKILRGETVDAAAYEQFLSEENALGKANLAKYVVHRRVLLDLFRRALEQQENGKYSLEEAVHKLVFPLRKTSDEVPYEQLNLWMIDERLGYHYYLASDKELRAATLLDSEEKQRPDLLVFNSPFAFTDATPFSSVILVEFKRPLRDDFNGDENPIAQVFDYVERIRSGKAKDRNGRPIDVPAHLPFYCYVICDLTTSMRQAARLASLTEAPDRAGYFGYNASYGAYVEVISFNKLLSDAEKRNRVFFEKLNVK